MNACMRQVISSSMNSWVINLTCIILTLSQPMLFAYLAQRLFVQKLIKFTREISIDHSLYFVADCNTFLTVR